MAKNSVETTSGFISGIQQVGIGVADACESMHLYKKIFGMDVLVFDDIAEASMMQKYTGNQSHLRRAILTLNMQGGGGLEIWQFLKRMPVWPLAPVQKGDLGINTVKIKAMDIQEAWTFLKNSGIEVSAITPGYDNVSKFCLNDLEHNSFQVIQSTESFGKRKHVTGGVAGICIGVSHMEQSVLFYSCLLHNPAIVYDKYVSEKGSNFRIILMRKKQNGYGAFGKLLGSFDVELIQALDKPGKKIFQDRFWGDHGFIHVCFDVFNMDAMKTTLQKSGYSFTVDSENSFGMEHASGRFCYVEDPDGTLIELVETHKIPVWKKWRIYLNLNKKNLSKPLPSWVIKLLSLSKVK
ncbi:MAG: VOC family protein [Ferruginibacter sp.]